MSRATIALLVTWFVIGIGAAFYGGYYYGKHQTVKVQNTNFGPPVEQKDESGTAKTTEGNTVKEDSESKSTPTTSSTPTASSNDSTTKIIE